MNLAIQLAAILLFILCPIGTLSYAQPTQVPAAITVRDTPLPSEGGASTGSDKAATAQTFESLKFRANFQLILTAIVTLFGLLSLALVAWVFRPSIARDIERVVRLFIVVIVVAASLILITGGYSNDQIAPAFGLFGTIVGYILGSSGRRPEAGDRPTDTAGGEQRRT